MAIYLDIDGEEVIRMNWTKGRGRKMHLARQERGLSLRALTTKTNMHLSCVASLDNGDKPSITNKELLKICAALNLKLKDLGYEIL